MVVSYKNNTKIQFFALLNPTPNFEMMYLFPTVG